MGSLTRTDNLLTDERRFRTLVENISDYAIFMLDPKGHVATWNAGAERFKGYAASEIIGEHFSKFYTEEDRREGMPQVALETARQQGRFEREGWRVRKDGSRFWAHVVIDAIRDDRGEFVGFAKITRDLTERKSAQEELRRSEEQFRLLVEGVSDYAIFMLDPSGHIASWNSGAERIKGYSKNEIVGKHFSLFYTEEDRAARLPAHVLETAARTGTFEAEGWRVRKDGSRFWAYVVVNALRDDHGTLVGFAKITRDNTERRAAQQATEAFAYSVSHDLRAPLRGIEAFARILLEDFNDNLGPAGRRYADRIAAAADRLQGLITDLLTFSRLQRAEIKLRPVDPARIARRQAEQVRALTGGEDAIIDVIEPLPPVQAEPAVLEQVFFNLLSNAVKFRRPGEHARVRVWGEREEDRVRLWVQDEGLGIAPEHQGRIFGAFERLHGQEAYPGSGIGLAIVKTGMERMSGAVGVFSRLGQGAKFWVELSAAPEMSNLN